MTETVDIRKAKTLLEEGATLGGGRNSERLMDVRLYGKILRAIQWTCASGMKGLEKEFRASETSLSEGEQAAFILETDGSICWEDTEDLEASVSERFPDAPLKILPSWDEDFKGARLTLVVYREGEKRPRFSSIRQDYHFLEMAEKRELKCLHQEYGRMVGCDPIAVVGKKELSGLMEGHHVLWHGAASSNTSASVIVDKLKGEVLEKTLEYDVSGMLIILNADSEFTTLSEIAAVRDGLDSLLDNGEAAVAMNVLAEKSGIKSIACRVFLFGNPKYITGQVHLDYGRYEILLYHSEYKKVGHMITASFQDGELTVSRYDWGQYDRNSNGKTDEHHYFDRENTEKLCEALKVKRPEALLRKLRTRFATGYDGSDADDRIGQFCDRMGVRYDSRYFD